MKKEEFSSEIFTLDSFFSEEECMKYIQFSEYKGYEAASVTTSQGQKMIPAIRNNDRVIYYDIVLAQKLWERISIYVPPQIENMQAIGINEQFRFYRYQPGQRFNKHRDGRFRRDVREESRITLLIYLNEDFEGGETSFEEFKINPKTGLALCFTHEQRHKGEKVIQGTKYVLRSDIMYQRTA